MVIVVDIQSGKVCARNLFSFCPVILTDDLTRGELVDGRQAGE